MIKFNINDKAKIKVGSKVVYISRYQSFDGNKNIDTSNVVATVQLSTVLGGYRITFADVSFLPQKLQQYPYWFVNPSLVELY